MQETLYYYDVNLLYPFASLNDMPGLESRYESNINRVIGPTHDYEELLGLFYCMIEANNGYLGSLPYKYA